VGPRVDLDAIEKRREEKRRENFVLPEIETRPSSA
jgi:hypothetical protein